MIDEMPYLYAPHRPENVREKGSDAVRTNFAAHMYSKPFAKLVRHPRMVTPVMQIFGKLVYIHQFKINGKMAFEGDLCSGTRTTGPGRTTTSCLRHAP